MIILSAQHIAKSFGVNAVLRDVSLTVQQGDRIGLVGVNGCGKSTLMRILAGLDAQDGGEISLVRGLRVGYLAQQNMVTSGETVWNELQKVYEQVFAMEKKLREAQTGIAGESCAVDDEVVAAARDIFRPENMTVSVKGNKRKVDVGAIEEIMKTL